MEDKETLIFEVKFDAQQAKQNAELLTHVIAQLRKEKQETEREFRKGEIGLEEYGKSMRSIDTQLVKAQASYKEINKQISDNEKVQKAAAGSMDEMKAKLALLIPAYGALSKEQRNATDTGVALKAQIKALNDELKELESGYGSNQRQVGSYAEAIEKAIRGNSDWISQIRSTRDALKENYKSAQQYVIGLRAMAAGASLTEKGFLALKLAMSAVGIGLLITALTALIGIFSKTQAGLDFIERSTASLTAIFDTFIVKSEAIARALTKIFTDPKTAILEAGEQMLDFFGKASDAASAVNKITASNQRLRESEREVMVERAKNRAEVEKLNLIAEDVSKSTAVRRKAAQDAAALEQKTLQRINDIQAQRIKNERELYELGTKTAKDRDKIAEKEKEYADSQEESFSKQTEINNRLNQINLDGIQKAKEARQLAAREAVAEAEGALIMARRKGIDTLRIEEELIRRRGEAEKAGLEKGAKQRKLIDVRVQAEIAELEVQHELDIQHRLLDTKAATIAAELALADQGTKAENDAHIKAIRLQAQRDITELQAQLKLKLITQSDYDERLAAIQNASNRAISEKRLEYEQLVNERLGRINSDLITARLSEARKGSSEELDIRREAIDKRVEYEEKAAKLSIRNEEELVARLKAIRAKAIEDLAALDAEEVAQYMQRRTDTNSILAAKAREGSRDELDARKEMIYTAAAEELRVAGANELAREAVFERMNRAIADADREFMRGRVNKVLEMANEANVVFSNLVSAQVQAQQNTLDEQQTAALKSAGLSAEARTKIEADFQDKKLALEKKAAESRRRIATIENIINTASAVVTALKEPFPYDIIKTALVVATGAAQQAVIASSRFARGGVINGPSHADGGVKYQIGRQQVELEGGEGVINKHAMQIPYVRRKASELNQMAGDGVAFDASSVYSKPNWKNAVNRIQYRPPVRMAMGGLTPAPPASVDLDYDKLGQAVSGMVVEAVKALPPSYVAVTDMRAGIGKQVRVEQNADY